MQNHVVPAFGEDHFNCPHCGVYAMQFRYNLHTTVGNSDPTFINDFSLSECVHCRKQVVWDTDRHAMIYPNTLPTGPDPNPDLPDEIRSDYQEARLIAATSPRGAAALLRLAIQKLCIHLGGNGKNLDHDIAQLVRQGLNPDVQMMLDSIRVIGNNAVHPLEIDLQERGDLVMALFGLVNEIADELITRPRRRREIYDQLPQGARDGIEKRDRKVLQERESNEPT